MDAVLRAALVLGCQEAVVRFFAALDDGRMDAVAGAMAADGVWHRQGKALTGPGEVAAALAVRPAGRVTAHLVQNFAVDLEDERNARIRYFVLTYRHDAADGKADPARVAPLGLPYSIAAYDDRLQSIDGQWRVLERRSRNVFVSG